MAVRMPLLLVALLVLPLLASADEAVTDVTGVDLEDISGVTLYSASKFEQSVAQAPARVTIITADEIKKYGYRTLADILRSVPGIAVTYDRNYYYLGVRGFGRTGDWNSRFLVLIDGHRLNENIYDAVYVGTEFILDIDLIKRIEVIQGPGFSIYGANAFLGVISIITRRGEDIGGAELSGEAGSFDTYTGRVSYGNIFRGPFDVVVSGSAYDSNGQSSLFYKEYDEPETNNGFTHGTDYERANRYFASLSYGDIRLQGAYISRTKGVPTGAYGTDFNEPRNRTLDQLGYIDLRYQHDFGYGTELLARAFYNAYRFDGDYLFSGVVNKEEARGEWWGGELQLTRTLWERHRVLVGAEYQNNTRQDIRNFDKEPFLSYFDTRRTSERWSVYGEDEIRVLDSLIVNLGIRHDDYESVGSTTNPRIALIYTPLEKTTFKAIYSSAYRAPNTFELSFDSPVGGIKANPDLKPEKIGTYQLVCEQLLGNHLIATASGFYYKIKDLIRQQIDPADGLLVSRNVDEVEAKGAGITLEGMWENGLRGKVSYAYQDARDGKTDVWLANSARHMAKFNLIIPLVRDRVFTGFEAQYLSKRKTLSGGSAGDVFVTNLTLFSQEIVKGLEASASIYNLFNRKYGDPGGEEHRQNVIEQDGRTFRFKITYRF